MLHRVAAVGLPLQQGDPQRVTSTGGNVASILDFPTRDGCVLHIPGVVISSRRKRDLPAPDGRSGIP